MIICIFLCYSIITYIIYSMNICIISSKYRNNLLHSKALHFFTKGLHFLLSSVQSAHIITTVEFIRQPHLPST